MDGRLRRIFAVPALVGAASTAGLVAGLMGDGLWDAAAWLGLAPAVALALWHGARPRSRRSPGS